MKVSVVIPCYNDYKQITGIVKVLRRSHLFSEIIIVDDGSDLLTKKILNQLSGVNLIRHEVNKGKSQALKTGVNHSHSNTILFLDSDIIGLTKTHLQKLIYPVLNNICDVCIGQFDDPFKFFIKIGQTTMLSGLRCYRKKFLTNNPQLFGNIGYVNGYLFEVRSNQILISQSLRVVKTTLPNLTQKYKWQKSRFIKGAANDFKIILNIIRYLGVRKYLSQLLYCQQLLHFP